MRILILDRTRHFVCESERDMHTAALKVVNERRRLLDEGPEKTFVESVTEDMDGETALVLLNKWFEVEIAVAEVI